MSTERALLHTRTVEFKGYKRGDGLWDIEGDLRDFRDYDTLVPEKGLLPANAAVHHMAITVTVDDELVVRAVTTRMHATPFRTCREIEGSLQAMVGVPMGRGWRHAVKDRLGGVGSCTHLRELLLNMATAALQTTPTWQSQERKRQGLYAFHGDRPHFLGQCHAWRLHGPLVYAEHFPQFHQPKPSADDPSAKE